MRLASAPPLAVTTGKSILVSAATVRGKNLPNAVAGFLTVMSVAALTAARAVIGPRPFTKKGSLMAMLAVEAVAKVRVAHETNEGIKADEGAAHEHGDHNRKLKLKLKLKKKTIKAKKIEKRRKLKAIRTHALQRKIESAGHFTQVPPPPAGKDAPEPWDELPSLP